MLFVESLTNLVLNHFLSRYIADVQKHVTRMMLVKQEIVPVTVPVATVTTGILNTLGDINAVAVLLQIPLLLLLMLVCHHLQM